MAEVEKKAEKPVEKPKPEPELRERPCVVWERDTKDGRVRVVAKGEKLTPEKQLGTDDGGRCLAIHPVGWGGPAWVQLIAEEHLKLLAKGENEEERKPPNYEVGVL